MGAIKVQSLEAAREAIDEFVHNLANGDPQSSFSAAALDAASIKVLDVSRTEDAKYSSLVVEMQATDKMANGLGNVHGGCVATIVDCITSACIYNHTTNQIPDPWSMLGVSQSLSIVYLSPLPIEGWMDILITVASVGKSISVTQAEIWVKDGPGGKRIRKAALGTHTKVDNSSQARI
ncbi:hypothetical protein OC846_005423 [Tilletia horrida]|uniref:Thioesterase domain-containing protein n=1 Tax=Tilletia horrida TaxID=155126 RepID=A0AAN6JRR0_9BASI|nr:hypothetical protein OC846_005423 [Tilletia horrida]KAK0567301.1 hypothetical protein OC861_002805 [Tilletia horrida]